MKGLFFTALFLLSTVCFGEQEKGMDGKSAVLEAGYDEMKCYFNSLARKPGIETVVVPKSFNWLFKRKLRKELSSVEDCPAPVADIIDRIEGIALIEYGGLEKDEQENLENELDGILTDKKGNIPFKIILSGENTDEKVYSRMIFHSQESKSFIIIKGLFSFEKNEIEN